MGTNAALRPRLAELGMTHAELARRVNEELAKLTGRPGTVCERTVHNWVIGKTRWPQERIRIALTAVFGCPLSELGFAPRTARTAAPEDVVQRRQFLALPVAAIAAAPTARTTTIGSSDVERLRTQLDTLVVLDDHQGGHAALERAAVAGAQHSLQLQDGSATERVRRLLYSVAADYTAMAAWSCVDAREFDRAQQHLDRCMTLAGLAQDGTAQLRTWNLMALLYRQQENHTQGLAAAQAAQHTRVVRHDPFLRSLAHARTALAQSSLRDRQAARRSLGHAEDSLLQAPADVPRPSWTDFYGHPELDALSAIVLDSTGDAELAEAAGHRALSAIPPRFRRNRGLATAQLALAQLHQGDVPQACDTAGAVFDIMHGTPVPARMKTLLGDFHRGLLTLARGSTEARQWGDRMRTEWSRA
jgi:tetratricopeptide (TPR) repeat protein